MVKTGDSTLVPVSPPSVVSFCPCRPTALLECAEVQGTTSPVFDKPVFESTEVAFSDCGSRRALQCMSGDRKGP